VTHPTAPASAPQRASVLDLGSNSFHVLVADVDGHSITPVLREREMLHLGRAVAQHGAVPDEDRARAVATVAHLAELGRRAGATEHLAVATAALRAATNGREVLADLEAAGDLRIRTLDGLEEARLAYLGVRASVAVRGEPTLVLDLGGGSLELALGRGPTIEWATSAPLGASALSADLPTGRLKGKQVEAVRRRVHAELAEARAVVPAAAPHLTVAVGGTVRALARVAATRRSDWLPASINQLTVTRDELAELRDELIALDLDERTAIPALKDRRADHIHIAAVVVHAALECVDSSEVVVSDWGLREGLLLDAHGIADVPAAEQLRASGVSRLRRTFVPDDPHPVHVRRLALELFDGTRPVHGLDDVDRELLGHAAELHAIGEALHLRRQQLHGAYLLANAELRGFAPAETALLTTLVRYHRSRDLDPAYPAAAALTDGDRDRARRLLALLQVADGLDRAHDQSVTHVRTELTDDGVTFHLDGNGLHVTPEEAARKTRLFAEVTGRDVELVDAGSA
jgi:exopolyphosphatase/guanosine-5'-triphosphate,3'-diphosphate pyrophosphatase